MKNFARIGIYWLALLMHASLPAAPPASAGAQSIGMEGTSDNVNSYEIVSIKPHKGDSNSAEMRSLPDGFEWINRPLSALVWASYGIIMDSQVSRLPGWAGQENYDIVAKVDADTAERWKKLTRKQRLEEEQPMMRSILANRCQFKAHQEAKELPVYDLVIASGGLKMKEASANEAPTEMLRDGQMTVHAMAIDNSTLSAFAVMEGRMIVDKTGLGDKTFDFELRWSPDDHPSADEPAPSLLTAFQEQLGLKLVPARGPVEVLVIDQMERPSPN